MIPLSYSKMNCYLNCPRQYKYSNIDKLPMIKSHELLVGEATHSYIEILSKQLDKNSDVKIDEYAIWLKISENYTVDVINTCKTIWGHYRSQYYKMFYKYNPDVYKCEYELQLAINNKYELTEWLAKDVSYRAKFDKIVIDYDNSELTIIDYKTGMGETDIFQLKMYAWMLSKAFPDMVKYTLILDYIKKHKTETHVVNITELDEIEREIISIAHKIDNDSTYNRKPSYLCAYCSYTDKCVDAKNIQDVIKGAISTPDEALAVLETQILVEGYLKQLEKKTKEYVENKGAINTENATYKYNPKYTKKITDKTKFFEIIQDIGLSPLDYFNPVGYSKIEKNKLLCMEVEGILEEECYSNTIQLVRNTDDDLT